MNGDTIGAPYGLSAALVCTRIVHPAVRQVVTSNCTGRFLFRVATMPTDRDTIRAWLDSGAETPSTDAVAAFVRLAGLGGLHDWWEYGDSLVAREFRQQNPSFHPMTCPNRNDYAHRDYADEMSHHDHGILTATADGWVCPVCGYSQAVNPGGPRLTHTVPELSALPRASVQADVCPTPAAPFPLAEPVPAPITGCDVVARGCLSQPHRAGA